LPGNLVLSVSGEKLFVAEINLNHIVDRGQFHPPVQRSPPNPPAESFRHRTRSNWRGVIITPSGVFFSRHPPITLHRSRENIPLCRFNRERNQTLRWDPPLISFQLGLSFLTLPRARPVPFSLRTIFFPLSAGPSHISSLFQWNPLLCRFSLRSNFFNKTGSVDSPLTTRSL